MDCDAKDMTNTEINIAIAKACGWVRYTGFEVDRWWPPKELRTYANLEDDCPDYCHDLNAMNEAEQSLGRFSCFDEIGECGPFGYYFTELSEVTERESHPMFTATAHQRAEAFLRAKGLWHD